MGKYSRFIIAAFLGLLLVFTVIYIKSPADQNRGLRYYVNKTFGKECAGYSQSIYSRRLQDRIPDYIERSSRSGITKSANKKELRRKVARNELFRINGGKGYIIEDLSFSYPYLTNDGKKAAVRNRNEIQKEDFRDQVKRIRFHCDLNDQNN